MDFDVLPGPSLPELARTALASAAAATVCHAGPAAGPAAGQVPVRNGPAGSPVLLASTGSALAGQLAARPPAVTVSVPAKVPFSALRLTGPAEPAAHDPPPG